MSGSSRNVSIFARKLGWSADYAGMPKTKLALAVDSPDVSVPIGIQYGIGKVS